MIGRFRRDQNGRQTAAKGAFRPLSEAPANRVRTRAEIIVEVIDKQRVTPRLFGALRRHMSLALLN
jgi:hypothetical protein